MEWCPAGTTRHSPRTFPSKAPPPPQRDQAHQARAMPSAETTWVPGQRRIPGADHLIRATFEQSRGGLDGAVVSVPGTHFEIDTNIARDTMFST